MIEHNKAEQADAQKAESAGRTTASNAERSADHTAENTAERTAQIRQRKIDQLRSVDPSFVSSEGVVNVQAIKDALGVENTASNNRGYELGFAGKGIARSLADTATNKELRLESAQSKNIDTTENIIIRGDNLDVLKILRQNYSGTIKMIYIDPPYNTESAEFVYNDSFKLSEQELMENLGLEEDTFNYIENMLGSKTHSGWLFFMYPRLRLARDLLSDNGVIFISIDDNEQANLKLLCDEIFGEQNFLAEIVWQGMDTIKNDATYFSDNHEYILCYAKDKTKAEIKGQKRPEEFNTNYKNKDNDERGKYLLTPLYAKSGTEKNRDVHIFENGRTYQPPQGRYWRFAKKTLEYLERDNRIFFPEKEDGTPLKKTFLSEVSDRVNLTTFWSYDFAGSTRQSNYEISELLTKGIFSNPKPVRLLKILADAVLNANDTVLDFFAGSGTTAQAVMDINKNDNGKRKFILVQWDEAIDPQKNQPAYNFCVESGLAPVISSICIERVRRAGAKYEHGEGTRSAMLDTGYKVFSLANRPRIRVSDAGQAELISARHSHWDSLYNAMCASGAVLLSQPIEELEAERLYKVDNYYFLLGECQSDLSALPLIFVDGYADIRLESWLNMLGLDKDRVQIVY